MGNVEHYSMEKIFPSSQNQDNPSTKSQENYQIHNEENLQYFSDSFNPKKQSLLQLTVSDYLQIDMIMKNISMYSRQSGSQLGYPSISSLKQYFKVRKQGYCTKQTIFYLIFQGCNCCSLKDQFGVRKLVNKKFSESEILSILKTYLAGILIYSRQFKRNIQKIDLDDIGFQIFDSLYSGRNQQLNSVFNIQNEKKMKLYFVEPWLKQKRQNQIITVNQVNILLQNPSPQRLKQNSQRFSDIDSQKLRNNSNENQLYLQNQKQLFSLLFSIGVIGLKLLEMSFVDDIYYRSPNKKVNYERIQFYLQKHLHNKNIPNKPNGLVYDFNVTRQKLIEGLKILLLENEPKDRQKIYDVWGIKLHQVNYLQEINLSSSEHFQTGRQLPDQSPRHLQIRPLNQQNSQNPIRAVQNNGAPNLNKNRKFYQVETSTIRNHEFHKINAGLQASNEYLSNQQVLKEGPIVQKQALKNVPYVFKLDQLKQPNAINSNIPFSNHPNHASFNQDRHVTVQNNTNQFISQNHNTFSQMNVQNQIKSHQYQRVNLPTGYNHHANPYKKVVQYGHNNYKGQPSNIIYAQK